jgi:hypothetical protein
MHPVARLSCPPCPAGLLTDKWFPKDNPSHLRWRLRHNILRLMAVRCAAPRCGSPPQRGLALMSPAWCPDRARSRFFNDLAQPWRCCFCLPLHAGVDVPVAPFEQEECGLMDPATHQWAEGSPMVDEVQRELLQLQQRSLEVGPHSLWLGRQYLL